MSFAERHRRLLLQREGLRLRSAELRSQLADEAQVLRTPLQLADQLRSGWQWLRAHPEWPLGALAALVLLRPRRALRWSSRLWWAWGLWQRGQRALQAAVAPRH